MQICPLCGLDLEDSYLYCPEDGSILKGPEKPALEKDLPEEANETAARPVVLYCPACAAEYPLTFSECPVHGVPLTKHRLPTFIEPPAQVIQERQEASITDSRARIHRDAKGPSSPATFIASSPVESQSYSTPANISRLNEEVLPIPDDGIEEYTSDYDTAPLTEVKADPYSKSFRVAAVIIVAGLAVLSLAGLYTFYVNATRKPASQSAKSANKPLVVTSESAFIPTPEEARDYKEERQTESEIAVPAESEKSRSDKESNLKESSLAAAPSRQAVQKTDDRTPTPLAKQQPAIATQIPSPAKRQTGATDLVLPRGTYGLVDARLIRMRARQTASGMRYDLTFNLEEQAGRTTQYERLAVVTRSASGINHSEAMPFYHRLGAAGSLTFTISVEMRGRGEADWQGRIICTGIGTDNQGRPLRTSFGANVSP